jgi:predicted glycosyltransferase
LARLGGLKILSDKDLGPERLAGLMAQMLKEKERSAGVIDLDGAEKTAAWITEIQGLRV